MRQTAGTERDPLPWCLAIAAAFMALALFRLGTPSTIYFDEVHYLKAARRLLELTPANREHPMFAKEVLAASIWLFGDTAFFWRLPSLLFGTLGLYAFGRIVWLASGRRVATIAAMVLLSTNFMWFVQSRIAMLDMTSAGIGMAGFWQFAAALRAKGPWRARGHLALAGLAFGLSLGAKWSIAPALALPGLAFLALRARESGWRIVGIRGAGPIPGVSLAEAAFWLGLVPLAVYWATYLPAMFYTDRPVDPLGFIEQHKYMLKLQDSVKKPHPYQSYWYQWIADWRSIWYLYQNVDGAQRGIVMLGNPFTMLAGLAAIGWAIWAGLRKGRGDALVFVLLYLATLVMWVFNGKPVQFYYHYLLPGAFLAACLALALDEIGQRQDRWRWVMPGSLLAASVLFAVFYPILSAAPLCCTGSFAIWMWLPSWR